MRQVKFRNWSPIMKKMLDWETVQDMSCFLAVTESDANIPMQFTGLLDKNGKEIYEGDIIKYCVKSISEIKYGEIKCVLECFIVKVGSIHFPMSGLDEIYATIDGEIIGNIYESKHLLDNTDTKA